ncbi:MAG: Tad domain-containing protein [Chloroflexi bacterium]|nr:Tad domain-containing protein [Chloroflexota bacterium]
MKSVRKSTYEKGQVIVLIAAMMVGMIAMIGLAVDGGGLYFLNRDLQNAVDAAVIAATYAKCTGGDVVFAGETAAADNGFELGDGRTMTVEIHDPATGVALPAGADINDYVSVSISAEKPSYFIQVVRGNDPLIVEAAGVGYCKESDTNDSGRAVFGACDTGGDAVRIESGGGASDPCPGGNSEIVGGIHSESDGGSNQGTCVPEGDVTSGTNTDGYHGTSNEGPPEVESHDMPLYWEIEEFDELSDEIPQAFVLQFGPDAYWVPPTNTITEEDLFLPGATNTDDSARLIYYNGDLTVKGATSGALQSKFGPLTGGQAFYDAHVTIVVTGKLSLSGDVKDTKFVHAGKAFDADGGPTSYLLFMSTVGGGTNCNNTPDAIFWSASEAAWEGLIYAPTGNVNMSMSGNDASGLGGIFAWTVRSLSGSHIYITFDPDMLPPDPPSIGIAD